MADDDWGAAAATEEMNQVSLNSPNSGWNEMSGQPRQTTVTGLKAGGRGRGLITAKSALRPGLRGDNSSGWEEDDKVTSMADASLLNKVLHSKLVTTKSDITVQHQDPKSPLYSVKSFEALHFSARLSVEQEKLIIDAIKGQFDEASSFPDIDRNFIYFTTSKISKTFRVNSKKYALRKPDLLKGIYDMGFSFPSKIQEKALPAILAYPPANMIAQSQSGTGKTAAFVCCMLSRVRAENQYPQCLCLSPTFELALQTAAVIERMAKYMTGVSIRRAVKGERVQRGEKVTEQIIVGTPGTLMDWALKFRVFDMSKIVTFVLDEADVMISLQGHQDQSVRLQRGLREDCQMLLFSATYNDEVMKFAKAIIPNSPIVIQLRREEESLDNIKQYYIRCHSNDDKFRSLSNIYGSITIGQSMIFCRTRRTAEWLSQEMTNEGHAVALLSGDLDVEQRQAVIERFRDGKEKVLITTNVSARGLDIEQVTVVVNFDLPTNRDNTEPDYETYLHRIGRTGRFGKSGLAINYVDGSRTVEMLDKIRNYFGREINPLNTDDANEIEKIGN